MEQLNLFPWEKRARRRGATPVQPTTMESTVESRILKAYVKDCLVGYELRQRARESKRNGRKPQQMELFG
jgi:hypothetical protein